MDPNIIESEIQTGLLPKQQLFCEEYIKDFHGTNAAIRAGYEDRNAAVTASKMLADDRFRKYIKTLLDAIGLDEHETKKLIADIARSSLNDYFTFKKVLYTPKIEKPLSDLISELRAEMDFENEYALAASLKGQDLELHQVGQCRRERQLLRYELELKRNSDAVRIVDGPARLIDVPELDMAKLVADKEKGRIKSITPGQFGTKVELYAADAALTNLAKMHGLFEKDNSHRHEHTGKDGTPLKAPVTFISADALTPEQIEKYLNGDRTNDEGF
ncbi:hypothetical protein DYBT9623_04429 [Dyadobacter sp. CECT 9623]|uniref:Terminase small subunit n=1 Tax=Dyadobacter linearis TaxID=2823330 RepID=A0ABN7RCE5_9BACT|nr:terminase small subunit [Dyadobacter sp. CECT 9623]CAG5072890.1 hypothetical protein DYBT9623_04429 [Dyadobacter sp. CECT 9623]